MYSIISNIISGSNDTVTAVCGVIACVLVAELSIMILKFFRIFQK